MIRRAIEEVRDKMKQFLGRKQEFMENLIRFWFEGERNEEDIVEFVLRLEYGGAEE